jgi:hypothetical protein
LIHRRFGIVHYLKFPKVAEQAWRNWGSGKTLKAATMRHVSWRLMPFLMVAYLLCYIDQINRLAAHSPQWRVR